MTKVTYYTLLVRYKLILWLQTKQWFRKWMGGNWYFICDIESGEEFWIHQEEPNPWLVIVIKEEHWGG